MTIELLAQYDTLTIEKGLEFILNHFDDSEPMWPRMISTYSTGGGQRVVRNPIQAIAWFKASKLLNSRISGYLNYTDYYINHTGIAPSLLLVDLDRKQFATYEEFELAAAKTYTNFKEILGFKPTQLWTGSGYHFILRQNVFVFEKVEEFKKFREPSRRFMHFEEELLTDGKGDQNHWSTVSFNNCMLRIPGSLNAKLVRFDNRHNIVDIPPEAYVKVVKPWDGVSAQIGPSIVRKYYTWLRAEEIRDIERRRAREAKYKVWSRKYGHIYGRTRGCMNLPDYAYIEKLIKKPIETHRNYCVWKILVPYCINIKGLSKLQTFDTVKSWLDKCNSVARLDFDPKRKIDYELDHVGKYRPIPQNQLKEGHPKLYALLEREGVITY